VPACGNRYGASAFDAAYPTLREESVTYGAADCTRDVGAAFAPIQTRATENWSAAGLRKVKIDPKAKQEGCSILREDATIWRKFDVAQLHHSVSH